MEGRKRQKRLREQAPERYRLKEGATRKGTARENPDPYPSPAGAQAKATAGEEDETFNRPDGQSRLRLRAMVFPPTHGSSSLLRCSCLRYYLTRQ